MEQKRDPTVLAPTVEDVSKANSQSPAPLDESRALRRLLVRGLRREGAGKLCKEEPSDFTLGAELFSVALLCSALLGLLIFAVEQLGWTIWGTAGALVLALLSAAALAMLTSPAVPYLLVLLGWAISGVVQLAGPGLGALALTHALPFAVVFGARWGWGALRLAAGIPLFIPVALIVVLSPFLSEDPWRLGAAAGWQLVALAVVAVLPLLALVAARLLRLSVADTFAAAAERLSPEREDEALELVNKLGREEDEEQLDETKARTRLRRAYEAPFPADRAPQFAGTVSRVFKQRAVLRLLPLTVGIAAAVWSLIYVLASASIPASLAAEWSGRAVPRADVAVLGLEIPLPLGPYLTLAALLAIVATVGFLAFALTEDRYSAALSEGLVSRPAERVLLLALPYADLNEPRRRRRGSDHREKKAERQNTAASQR